LEKELMFTFEILWLVEFKNFQVIGEALSIKEYLE
jgi:hypothetical protein